MKNRTTLLGALVAITIVQGVAQPPPESQLVYLQPHAGDTFRVGDEVPIMLSAYAAADVFPSAELFANGEHFASVYYCCYLCPCAAPFPGMTMTLQIQVVHNPGDPPPPNQWQGWKFTAAGRYTLTAHAVGENGMVLDAAPVTITIDPPLDLSLHVSVGADGVLHFGVPQGSLTPHGMAMELSHDLLIWERIGMFEAGNVAAFYTDHPDPTDGRPRFYRAVSL